jgi:oligopeptide transport system substrate-binding protein
MFGLRAKWITGVAVVAAAALVAAGCGKSSGPKGGGPAPAPASQQQLILNIGSDIEGFDPAKASYVESLNVLNQLWDGLYRIEGTDSHLAPDLADGMPQITDGGLTYTVKLKKGLKWSDGQPLTADDVVAGVQHALDPKTGAYYASVMLDIVGACEYNNGIKAAKAKCPKVTTDGSAGAVGVTAVDPTTVKFQLNKPVPWFNMLLSLQTFYPLPKHVLDKNPNWSDATKNPTSYVSDGAFKLQSYSPRKDIAVVRNPNYMDASNVKLQAVDFRMIGDAAAASKEFTQGQLDTGYSNTMYPPAELSKWKSTKFFDSTPTSSTNYIYLNTKNKVLQDPRVRQGIALAIDRAKIVNDVTKRGDVISTTWIPSVMPNFDTIKQGSQDFINPNGSPDVAKAKQLLQEGGWKPGTSLNVYFASDSSTAPDVMASVQADLAAVGVQLKLNAVPGDVMQQPGTGVSPIAPKVDMVYEGWAADYLDPQDYYQLLICKNIAAGLNAANFCDKDFDKLYGEALNTVDDTDRAQIYKQLEAMITGPNGQMPGIPLYQPKDTTLVQTYVKNFALLPSSFFYLNNVYIAKH